MGTIMRVISIQIQPERVAGLDVKAALGLFRKVAGKSVHIADIKVKEASRRQYINVNFLTRNRKKAWADIKKAAFDNKKVGAALKGCAIVICEGQHSWEDYLLLHHFDCSKVTRGEVETLCATAYKYLKKDDHRQAFPLLQKAAELGDSWAQYHLGFSYQEGQGVRKDLKKAMGWYEKSARSGYDSAQLNLGILFALRFKNFRKAVEFYRLAAAQGNVDAQFNLGLYYEEGRPGVPVDRRKGFDWYLKAAQGGHVKAQHAVGYCYHEGLGRRRNARQAVQWYIKAARQGNIYSMYNLGLSYLSGDGVPQSCAQAVKWLRAAAGQGHTAAAKKLKQLATEG